MNTNVKGLDTLDARITLLYRRMSDYASQPHHQPLPHDMQTRIDELVK